MRKDDRQTDYLVSNGFGGSDLGSRVCLAQHLAWHCHPETAVRKILIGNLLF